MINFSKLIISNSCFKHLNRIIMCFIFVFLFSVVANANSKFNMSFIRGTTTSGLTNYLVNGDEILPGIYPFDIYLNQIKVDRQEVEFRKTSTTTPGYYCLTAEQYRSYGIRLPDINVESDCYKLTEQIKGSALKGNAALQELNLVVPQIYVKQKPKGEIPSNLYEDGINAAFVNYTFSGNHTSNKNKQTIKNKDYFFLSLNNGFNFGSWRFRNISSLQKQSGQSEQWKTILNWAETDIIPWRSRLKIGQSNTNNNVFDSIQFRGIQLSSVPDMLPYSLRGYAPVIRGVAHSNARVEIKQNGYTVYSTIVPPGPFALTDITPSTQNGDLTVTVIESDGSRYQFIVPYSSVPNMLREGILEYQLTAGKYHNGVTSYEPNFIQGTLSQGISGNLTPYTGILISEHHRSATIGVSKNMGYFGALSVDVSWSDTDLASGDHKRGASLRFLYSKSITQFGTNFKIAGYRYSTSGFYDFSDAVSERNNWKNGFYHTVYYDPDNNQKNDPSKSQYQRYYDSLRYYNKRQRIELFLNQNLTNASLYASFVQQNYWSTSSKDRTLQTGFSSTLNKISYNIFYQNSRSNRGYNDNSVNINVSIPFSIFNNKNNMRINLNANHSKQNSNGYTTGLSGSLLDDNRMNYFVQTGYSNYSGNSGLINLNYHSSVSNIDLGYSYNDNYKQTSLDLSGGIVVHSDGITLSQPLQNTFVVVKAPGAQGVRLENNPGVEIDYFGHAIMTSATPYNHNRVALRTSDIGNGLEIEQSAKDIVPTYGAIGRVTFTTHLGHSLLIRSLMEDGSEPILGANIFNKKGQRIGVVGMRGEVYVFGVSSGETVLMKWGEEELNSCVMTIPKLPNLDNHKLVGYQTVSLICNLLKGSY